MRDLFLRIVPCRVRGFERISPLLHGSALCLKGGVCGE